MGGLCGHGKNAAGIEKPWSWLQEVWGYVETVEPVEVTREHAGSSRVYSVAVEGLGAAVRTGKWE